MSSTPLLEIRDLHAGYRRRTGWLAGEGAWTDAVQGVSLELHRGRIHGLAGESGSGKSTLARALVQLVHIAAGSIRLEGRELLATSTGHLREARRRIQLIFQDPATALSPRRTIAQTLREPAVHFGLDASERRQAEVLEAVGLDASALGHLPRQFSSGQRQRIAIARALMCDPDVLVADEALSALDVSVQARVLDVLRTLRRERGLSLLLISHDLAVLRENADDTGVMYGGRLVEHGPTERVFTAPAHPYTRQLLTALPRLDPDVPFEPPPPGEGLASRARGAGCVFEPRCAEALARCRTRPPSRTALSGEPARRIECHLHDPDAH